MNDLQYFAARIRSFARKRRLLLDAALLYRLGALALLAAIAGLCVLAEPWHHPAYQQVLQRLVGDPELPVPLLRDLRINPWVNLTFVLTLALFWLALLVTVFVRWTPRRSPLDEAFRMEQLAGGLNSRIVSAWDFLTRGIETPLTRAVIVQAREDLGFDFEARLDRQRRDRERMRFLVVAVAFVALLLLPAFRWDNLKGNLARSWLAVVEVLFPIQFELEPKPGTHVYLIGTKVPVSIRFPGREYATVKRVIATDDGTGGSLKSAELPLDEAGQLTEEYSSDVETDYSVYFEFGNRRTEDINFVFTTRPLLVNMQTELVYPAYTRLLPRSLEGVQQRLVGLPGTRMVLGFTFSKELEEASLTWVGEDAAPLRLETTGRFATVELLHQRRRQASLQVRDKHGYSLEFPVVIDFEVQEDEKPQVLLPRHLKEDMPFLEEPAKLFGFGVQASDDFGVSRVVLKWQKSTVDSPNSVQDRGEIERIISPVQAKVIVNYEKVFGAWSLKPGDKITFWVEAYDNMAPKPQMTASRRCSFFVFQDALGGLSIKELGFGNDADPTRERIPKATKATAVKAPEGLRTKEGVKNEFEAAINSGTQAPTVRGEHSQATRDYFRLFSTVKYPEENQPTPKKEEKAPK